MQGNRLMTLDRRAMIEHTFALAAALAGGVAGFGIGTRMDSFLVALAMALNGAVCAALLAVSVTDVIERLRGRLRVRR